ncbi:probable E3 ubiquitin-protein ligase makorin-1 [Aplysia californica]|uniref:RING-type E3 ubiquitin transferase n=1 Tax=Aplysia californica TaxID=6500 RepID=A0ABM1A6A1_APLCA|nr:probable E3 ubiquitin-protein ligase makorin-1 [Aplysia californica]
MATGGFDPRMSGGRQIRLQVCRYFLHGACNRGDSCRFSHDKSRAVPVDNICRYYLAGNCVYGDRCRYDHVKTAVPSASELSTTSKKAENERNVPQLQSNMVKLKKGGLEQSLAHAKHEQEKELFEKKWVEAKDFVPGQKFHGSVPGSYAQAAHSDVDQAVGGFDPGKPPKEVTEEDLLCPYFAHGHCSFENCAYLHGEVCDMCGLPRLHPTNKDLRESHQKECLEEHRKEMELAFLMKDSSEKECGICLEVTTEKVGENGAPVDRRFGLLENCAHCFCLTCIKEWRKERYAEKETHRSCPICRTHSNFVTPSEFWVDSEEKKKELIADYLAEISKKPCQYFKQGKGECPFYDKCFYLHALPDGSIAPPQARPKRRRRVDADGEDHVEEYSLWDFFASRDDDSLISLDDELSLILLDVLHSDDEEERFGVRFNLENGDFVFTDSDSD